MPATFKDQLAVLDELLVEVRRMENGEKRFTSGTSPGSYEKELRLAGLAQRVAQSYTLIEGVLAFVARRIDRAPVTGEDWHKQLIRRSAQPLAEPGRPALITTALAADLLELCQFRHVVRNVYATRLDEARVRENLARLIRAARAFDAQCRAFANAPARSTPAPARSTPAPARSSPTPAPAGRRRSRRQ